MTPDPDRRRPASWDDVVSVVCLIAFVAIVATVAVVVLSAFLSAFQ